MAATVARRVGLLPLGPRKAPGWAGTSGGCAALVMLHEEVELDVHDRHWSISMARGQRGRAASARCLCAFTGGSSGRWMSCENAGRGRRRGRGRLSPGGRARRVIWADREGRRDSVRAQAAWLTCPVIGGRHGWALRRAGLWNPARRSARSDRAQRSLVRKRSWRFNCQHASVFSLQTGRSLP